MWLLHICLLAYLVAVYFPWETLITYLMTSHESDFMKNFAAHLYHHWRQWQLTIHIKKEFYPFISVACADYECGFYGVASGIYQGTAVWKGKRLPAAGLCNCSSICFVFICQQILFSNASSSTSYPGPKIPMNSWSIFFLQSHRFISYLKRQQKVHLARRFEIFRSRQHGLLGRGKAK